MEQDFDNSSGDVTIKKVGGLYREWFLDYASYVILERAIPAVNDGLKPVQRRILHTMREMEDGRYNKVANVVGSTMKYHPHGDAAITDAMVQIGQKGLIIDTQGNWGNILTGDAAAAYRYIEARLTKFALEVAFNPKTTHWQASYDGRNNEPIALPMKFPLLLAQGVEGIAVGLSTKILPHNFNELIDASIKHLRNKSFSLFPDFQTGGAIDVSDYKEGSRGGRVRVRAKINKRDNKTLTITELPYGVHTGSLIDSILKANDKGKIKIKKIEDNTASDVEILVHLVAGVSPDKSIDALYAFTDCETSIAPNACVIVENQPQFLSVSEILKINTDHTKSLLKRELEIALKELEEKWHFASLEKIFIENRIYRDIEEEETWEGVLLKIEKGLKPHIKLLRKEVTKEDILRLTEIRIKRISRFDLDKFQKDIEELDTKIEETQANLKDLVNYTIRYYKNLSKKYGKEWSRKTEIKTFETIDGAKVAAANMKFYVNREEGFIGSSLKRDEFLFECSDLDDIVVFRKGGQMSVVKVGSKTFVGKGIIHVGVWKKQDSRTVYNMIYRDGASGNAYMKRFSITSITRDKEYHLAGGDSKAEVLYFSANPNGEAELVEVFLRRKERLKKLRFTVDFSQLEIKGRSVKGNLVSKHRINKIALKQEGASTLAPRKIWYDEVVKRLNGEERGQYLGAFRGKDKILTINTKGEAKLKSFELSNRFDEELLRLEKWQPEQAITCIYFDGEKERFYIKRFILEDTDNVQTFYWAEHPNSYLELVLTESNVSIELKYINKKDDVAQIEAILVDNFIEIKGIKAKGNQLINKKIEDINAVIPKIKEEPQDTSDEKRVEKEKTDEQEPPTSDGTQGNLF